MGRNSFVICGRYVSFAAGAEKLVDQFLAIRSL